MIIKIDPQNIRASNDKGYNKRIEPSSYARMASNIIVKFVSVAVWVREDEFNCCCILLFYNLKVSDQWTEITVIP